MGRWQDNSVDLPPPDPLRHLPLGLISVGHYLPCHLSHTLTCALPPPPPSLSHTHTHTHTHTYTYSPRDTFTFTLLSCLCMIYSDWVPCRGLQTAQVGNERKSVAQ